MTWSDRKGVSSTYSEAIGTLRDTTWDSLLISQRDSSGTIQDRTSTRRETDPWSIVVSLEFADEQASVRFERYLKSGSGRAFAKRHFS